MGFFDGVGRMISAPIQRAMGKDKKDRDKFTPVQQYAYGSKEALDERNAQFREGEAGGNRMVDRGVRRGNRAADEASGALYGQADAMNVYAENMRNDGGENYDGFYEQLGNYGQARSGQLAVADQQQALANKMIGSADTMDKDYQRTDRTAFLGQQEGNMRQALALGGTGGAAGVRAALAGQIAANQAAANQANITRANETNNILALKQNALTSGANVLTSAANTRGSVGAQDQAAAGMFSARQQANDANRLTGLNSAASTVGNAAGIQQNAANAQIGAGSAKRGDYLNADVGVNTAQFTGNQNYELQRQGKEKDDYNQKWKPILSTFKA